MKTEKHAMKEWTMQDIDHANYLGTLEVEDECFDVLATETHLVFGGATNNCFLQSGYLELEDDENVDAAFRELRDDLETYYSDGRDYVSRIVCNDRM
jgi:hypothetical protein